MLACRLCDGGSRLDFPSDLYALELAADELHAELLWPTGASQGGRHSLPPSAQKLVVDVGQLGNSMCKQYIANAILARDVVLKQHQLRVQQVWAQPAAHLVSNS